jgi:hypothetical protein
MAMASSSAATAQRDALTALKNRSGVCRALGSVLIIFFYGEFRYFETVIVFHSIRGT